MKKCTPRACRSEKEWGRCSTFPGYIVGIMAESWLGTATMLRRCPSEEKPCKNSGCTLRPVLSTGKSAEHTDSAADRGVKAPYQNCNVPKSRYRVFLLSSFSQWALCTRNASFPAVGVKAAMVESQQFPSFPCMFLSGSYRCFYMLTLIIVSGCFRASNAMH